jgi:hypothetical protein
VVEIVRGQKKMGGSTLSLAPPGSASQPNKRFLLVGKPGLQWGKKKMCFCNQTCKPTEYNAQLFNIN